ncbi:TPA: transposase [Legionella pneumophila]|nr:transposase [Legionella pneumophila]HCE5478471.1 transposase [Legionella pneumophila]HCE5568472.1 transposase [Legionella pneumophila]
MADFLPLYSPDLNPIEKFWANLKAKIKKND